MSRWACTVCEVEWTTVAGRPVCFNCESEEHVQPTFEYPAWLWGYRNLNYRDIARPE